jgi:hypothetical protein
MYSLPFLISLSIALAAVFFFGTIYRHTFTDAIVDCITLRSAEPQGHKEHMLLGLGWHKVL